MFIEETSGRGPTLSRIESGTTMMLLCLPALTGNSYWSVCVSGQARHNQRKVRITQISDQGNTNPDKNILLIYNVCQQYYQINRFLDFRFYRQRLCLLGALNINIHLCSLFMGMSKSFLTCYISEVGFIECFKPQLLIYCYISLRT